jgi:hypothetical protein
MTRDESRDVYQLLVETSAPLLTIITSNRDKTKWLAMFDDTAPRAERRRPLQEQRLRPRHRRRVLPAEAEAFDRERAATRGSRDPIAVPRTEKETALRAVTTADA